MRSKVPETRFSCCPGRDFHGSRHALSWFRKRPKVPETRFSCCPERDFHGSRNALFMLPGTRFSWFPRSAFMVPETTLFGSRNDLHGSRNGFHGSRNAFMVPETWFPNRRAPWELCGYWWASGTTYIPARSQSARLANIGRAAAAATAAELARLPFAGRRYQDTSHVAKGRKQCRLCATSRAT